MISKEKAIEILSRFQNSGFGDPMHGGHITVSEIIELLKAEQEQTPKHIYAVEDQFGKQEHAGRHQNFYLQRRTAEAYAKRLNMYKHYQNNGITFRVVCYRLVPAPEEEGEPANEP